MKSIVLVNSKVSKWKYRITRNERYNCPPRCDYPEYPKGAMYRLPVVDYIDFENKVIRKVRYPKELHGFTSPTDPIEVEIRNLRNMYYDWLIIDIIK